MTKNIILILLAIFTFNCKKEKHVQYKASGFVMYDPIYKNGVIELHWTEARVQNFLTPYIITKLKITSSLMDADTIAVIHNRKITYFIDEGPFTEAGYQYNISCGGSSSGNLIIFDRDAIIYE